MPRKKLSGTRGARNLRRKTRKLHGRPRGRPFAPGNTAGLATRFQKGCKGNPGGHVGEKRKLVSQSLRKILAMQLGEVFEIETNADKLAAILVREGLYGRLNAIAEIIDRTEGKAHLSMSVDGQENPISELIRTMDAFHEQVGPPEQPNLDEEPKVQ